MKLVVIPGDGIGPETVSVGVDALKKVSEQTGAKVDMTHELAGHESLARYGTTVRPELVKTVQAADALMMGPMTTHNLKDESKGEINPSRFFRKHFDLFANIRPARTFEGAPIHIKPFDLVVVRENTEGFYADRNMASGGSEMLVTPDLVISLRRITRECCERIARSAFELAMTRSKKVTIVHKGNVLHLGDGMFIDSCHKIGKEFPEVKVDDVLVDAMMAYAVREPERFDVIVTTNMFGDILSDLTAELAGSLGMAASINAGEKFAMAQAAHGSAPDIAGKNVANPMSQVWSVAMLLNWYGQRHAAPAYLQASKRLEAAMVKTIAQGHVTRDMGGKLGTREVGDALLANLVK
jgi:3-isopropylmalate dehydrogenase